MVPLLAASLVTKPAMVFSALSAVLSWDRSLRIMPKTERSMAIAPSQARAGTVKVALVEVALAVSSGRTEQA